MDNNEPTKQDRVAKLIAGYRFSMEHNEPRKRSELDELRAILTGKEAENVHRPK